jgi:hypothetical protein
MAIIRKPISEERNDDCAKPMSKPRPMLVAWRTHEDDDFERLDDPNSLFWRGVWMAVF